MYSWILVFAVVFDSEALCDPIHKRKLMENPNLYEGDIVLPQNRSGRNAVVNDVQLWPNGTVPFKFDKPRIWRPSFIIKAMKAIERAVDGCVRFVPHTTETDYVVITENSAKRCQSSLGRRGGEQKIQLHFTCLDIGSIIHELMHALGFGHEHKRSDRDEYLRINFENIQEGLRKQLRKACNV